MPLAILPIFLFNILLTAFAQIAMKYGMTKVGSITNLGTMLGHALLNPWIGLGIFLYAISLLAWLFVLSRIDISIAFPMSSLAYVVNAVGAYYLLGEQITLPRIIGMFVIILGVVLLSRT